MKCCPLDKGAAYVLFVSRVLIKDDPRFAEEDSCEGTCVGKTALRILPGDQAQGCSAGDL